MLNKHIVEKNVCEDQLSSKTTSFQTCFAFETLAKNDLNDDENLNPVLKKRRLNTNQPEKHEVKYSAEVKLGFIMSYGAVPHVRREESTLRQRVTS